MALTLENGTEPDLNHLTFFPQGYLKSVVNQNRSRTFVACNISSDQFHTKKDNVLNIFFLLQCRMHERREVKGRQFERLL